MTIDQLSIEQVDEAIANIERHYKNAVGNIDILAMSKDEKLYATWILLVRRKRAHDREMGPQPKAEQ